MKGNELIAYALSFTAFLLRDKAVSEKISKIIVFGSAARGDFDEESDIDIFIETCLHERALQKQLDLFNKSKASELYRLMGLMNDIALRVGFLKKWKGLHESIVEDGIILYGKYEEAPKDIERLVLFRMSAGKKKVSLKVKLWRRLYGYTQKAGKKVYSNKGLLHELESVKISKGIFLVPFKNKQKIANFLDKNKASYQMIDIYKEVETQ